MAKTEFIQARSVVEAFSYLDSDGTSLLVAGGTDLFVKYKDGKVNPKRVVSIRRIPELCGISLQNKELVIGAATVLTDVIGSTLVKEHSPLLVDACSEIGSPQVRNRGTLGGNIGNASPAADSLQALIALNARLKLAGIAGEREISVEEVLIGPGKLNITNREIIKEVIVPSTKPNMTYAFEKYALKGGMDIALVNVAVNLGIENGTVLNSTICVGAVAPTPLRPAAAENALRGKALNQKLIEDAARLAADCSSPIDDVRASAGYRKHIVFVLTKRAIEKAAYGTGRCA